VTTLWFVIPIHRARVDVRELVAVRSDEWISDSGDPPDSIESGAWSLVCQPADGIVEWLKTASAELSTPRADVHR
jgi:hypothetical protein